MRRGEHLLSPLQQENNMEYIMRLLAKALLYLESKSGIDAVIIVSTVAVENYDN